MGKFLSILLIGLILMPLSFAGAELRFVQSRMPEQVSVHKSDDEAKMSNGITGVCAAGLKSARSGGIRKISWFGTLAAAMILAWAIDYLLICLHGKK